MLITTVQSTGSVRSHLTIFGSVNCGHRWQNFVFISGKSKTKVFHELESHLFVHLMMHAQTKTLDIINNGPLFTLLFHFLASFSLSFSVSCLFSRCVSFPLLTNSISSNKRFFIAFGGTCFSFASPAQTLCNFIELKPFAMCI